MHLSSYLSWSTLNGVSCLRGAIQVEVVIIKITSGFPHKSCQPLGVLLSAGAGSQTPLPNGSLVASPQLLHHASLKLAIDRLIRVCCPLAKFDIHAKISLHFQYFCE